MKHLLNTIFFIVLICTMTNSIGSLTVKNQNQSQNQNQNLLALRTSDTCEKQGVFGIKGICFGGEDLKKFVTKVLGQSSFGESGIFEDFVKPTLMALPTNLAPAVCFGDFDFNYIKTSQAGKDTKCAAFPMEDDTKISAVGFSFKNVPCGKPKRVDACAVFSKCGTFGLAISGGVLSCFTYATGVFAWLAEFGSLVKYIAFGYSPDRKWINKLELLDPKNNMKIKPVTTRGHIYMGAQISPPKTGIEIAGKDISEVIAFKLKGTALIDFGKINDWTPSNIKKMLNDKSRTPVEKMANMLLSVREVSFKARGSLEIALGKITKQIVPDLKIVDNMDCNILINFGKGLDGDTGSSDMPAGIHIFFRPPPMDIVGIFLEAIVNTMLKVLKLGFLPMPKFPRLDGIAFGLSLSQNFGFRLKIKSFEIMCMIKTSPKFAISCDLDWSGILTFFSDAGKWIAKQGKIFFDNAKKAIMEFGAAIGDFAKDVAAGAKIAAKAIVEAGKKIFEGAKKALNFAKQKALQAVNAVAGAVRELAKNIVAGLKKAAAFLKNALTNIANSIGNAIKNLANAIANIIKNIWNSIFNRKKYNRQKRQKEERKKKLEAQRKIEEAAEKKKYDEEKKHFDKEMDKVRNSVDKEKVKAAEDAQIEENDKQNELDSKQAELDEQETMALELEDM